jgi:hypothetical protein
MVKIVKILRNVGRLSSKAYCPSAAGFAVKKAVQPENFDEYHLSV